MEKKQAKVLPISKHLDQTPADAAISVHMQNLFATYGEAKVRKTLKELFGMGGQKRSRKAA